MVAVCNERVHAVHQPDQNARVSGARVARDIDPVPDVVADWGKAGLVRIPIRTDRDDRYFTDQFQAMPDKGYTAMFARMPDHPQIKLRLGTDWMDLRDQGLASRVIFTGPINEYFDHCYGRLPYRSLDFAQET